MSRRGAVEMQAGATLSSLKNLTIAALQALGLPVGRVGLEQIGNEELAEVPWAKTISGTLSGTKTLVFSGATVIAKSSNFVAANPDADPPVAGAGWCLYGDGVLKLYAGEFGGTIKVAGFSVAVDGTVTIGTGASKMVASPDGSFIWGTGGAVVGITPDGTLYAGGDNFADAVFTVDSSGNVTVRNTVSSMHHISLAAIVNDIATCVAVPPGGSYDTAVDVRLYNETQGVDIYFTMTTDGTEPSDPRAPGTLYDFTAIHLTADTVKIKAVAGKFAAFGMVQEWTFTQSNAGGGISVVPNPIASPAGGNYSTSTGQLTLTLSDSLAGASIRYTVDGTDPTTSHGTLISNGAGIPSAPLTISAQPYLKMLAYKIGLTSSAITLDIYNVTKGGTVGGGGGGGGGARLPY